MLSATANDSELTASTCPSLNHKATLQQLEQIDKVIHFYNEAYHVKKYSLITDDEFDALVQRRNQLASQLNQPSKTPSFELKNIATSPKTIEKPSDLHPLGTVKKAASSSQIKHFLKKAKDPVFLQPKIDGIAATLRYEKGVLISAHTRGNHSTVLGRDITTHILKIEDIVKILPEAISVTIQGEIFAKKHPHNPHLQFYTSARHFTAATLHQKSPSRDMLKQLSFFPWKVIINTDNNCLPCKSCLAQWGFLWVKQHTHVVNNFENIQDLYNHYNSYKNSNLPFLTDGIVLKTKGIPIELKQEDKAKLSETNNPLSTQQLAWKVQPRHGVATVKDILFSVGYTGKITVLLKLEPTYLQNRKIQQISLGSVYCWKNRDIAIGDHISIQLSGETIPTFNKVLVRPDNRYKPQTPNLNSFNASSCFHLSDHCKPQFLARIKRLIGRQGLNFQLNQKVLEEMVNKGEIKYLSDTLKAVNLTMPSTFYQQLMALGLPSIGAKSIQKIAKHYKSWPQLESALSSPSDSTILSKKQKNTLIAYLKLTEIRKIKLWLQSHTLYDKTAIKKIDQKKFPH